MTNLSNLSKSTLIAIIDDMNTTMYNKQYEVWELEKQLSSAQQEIDRLSYDLNEEREISSHLADALDDIMHHNEEHNEDCPNHHHEEEDEVDIKKVSSLPKEFWVDDYTEYSCKECGVLTRNDSVYLAHIGICEECLYNSIPF